MVFPKTVADTISLPIRIEIKEWPIGNYVELTVDFPPLCIDFPRIGFRRDIWEKSQRVFLEGIGGIPSIFPMIKCPLGPGGKAERDRLRAKRIIEKKRATASRA